MVWWHTNRVTMFSDGQRFKFSWRHVVLEGGRRVLNVSRLFNAHSAMMHSHFQEHSFNISGNWCGLEYEHLFHISPTEAWDFSDDYLVTLIQGTTSTKILRFSSVLEYILFVFSNIGRVILDFVLWYKYTITDSEMV